MRRAIVPGVFFGLLLPCVATAQQSSPSGAAVYKQRCAGCHEGSIPRMPNRAALAKMSPEHIESELASFSMRRQGAALSPAERRAVAEFLTGRPVGSYRAPIALIPKSAYCAAAPASAPFTVSGWRVSIAICFDAAQPTHALEAAGRGTDLYVASALYVQREARRADLHFGARAMDHRMFAALANHALTTGGHASLGGSGVWRPTGDVLQRAADASPSLLIVDLDPTELRAYRAVTSAA